MAEQEVRASTVTLRPPDRFDRNLPEIAVNVVLVEDPHPPADCEAIQWLLATTLSLETLEDIREIVAAYCQRCKLKSSSEH